MASILIDGSKVKRKQAISFSPQSVSNPKSESVDEKISEDLLSTISLKIRQEMDELYSQKLEDAYKRGYQKCEQDNKESTRNLKATIEDEKRKLITAETLFVDASDALHKAQSELYLKTKDELLLIVFEAVGRIVCEDYIKSNNRAEMLFNKIIENHISDKKVTLKFHCEDLDIIKSHYPSLINSNPNLTLVSCKNQEIGGVTLTSTDGELDLRLSTKLKQFQQLLIQSSYESSDV